MGAKTCMLSSKALCLTLTPFILATPWHALLAS